MSGFADTLRLKGMADEDIYFARRDRQLREQIRLRKAQRERAAATDGESADKQRRSGRESA